MCSRHLESSPTGVRTLWFYPTIGAAITVQPPPANVACPACQQVGSVAAADLLWRAPDHDQRSIRTATVTDGRSGGGACRVLREQVTARLVVHFSLERVLVLQRANLCSCRPRIDLVDEPLQVRQASPGVIAIIIGTARAQPHTDISTIVYLWPSM